MNKVSKLKEGLNKKLQREREEVIKLQKMYELEKELNWKKPEEEEVKFYKSEQEEVENLKSLIYDFKKEIGKLQEKLVNLRVENQKLMNELGQENRRINAAEVMVPPVSFESSFLENKEEESSRNLSLD